MTAIEYFLTSEEYNSYLCMTPNEIYDRFSAEPSQAELFDAVYEEEYLEQKKESSEMHRLFTAYVAAHQHLSSEDLYNEVGLYMDKEFRKYLDRKYPGMMEAYRTYGIDHDIDMFDAMGIYIGSNLFQTQPKENRMESASDELHTQIQKLDIITDLLMTNDKSMFLDPHGIASLLTDIVDGLKEVHSEIR